MKGEVGRVIQRHAGVVAAADGVDAPVSAKWRENMRGNADKTAAGELAAGL